MKPSKLRLVSVGMLLVVAPGMVLARPPYSLISVDYLQSEPLTSASVFPTQYSAIEVPGGAPGVAWRRTLSPKQLQLTFADTTGIEHDAVLSISNAMYHSASGDYPISSSPSSVTVHFTAGGSSTVTVELTGFPNFVTLGNLSVPFTLTSVYTGLGGDVGTRLYLLNAAPLNYGYGLQVPVWTDVLEDACLWATSRSGDADCRWWCTFKLYHSLVFVYYPKSVYYWGIDGAQDPPIVQYKLKQFFIDQGSPPLSWVNGDCRDVSSYLMITLSSIGVPIQTYWAFATPVANDPEPFDTNQLCGIGDDATDPTLYQSYDFNFHSITYVAGSDQVYDSVCAHWMDTSGANYQNPPMGWSLSSYWQVDHRPTMYFGSGFYGAVWRYTMNPNHPTAGEPVGREPLTPVVLQILK